jgi:hypothetical protein
MYMVFGEFKYQDLGGRPMMTKKELLERLKTELGSLEFGRSRRSVYMPWEDVSFFQDSVTCLNHGLEGRPHPCSECLLMQFVPEPSRNETNPCHHIPLDRKGNTIDRLDRGYNRSSVEESVAAWLRSKIAELEQDLAETTVAK